MKVSSSGDSNSDGAVGFGGSSSSFDGGSSSLSGIEEWRHIRREQDAAYQESLRIDRAKDSAKDNRERQEQVIINT